MEGREDRAEARFVLPTPHFPLGGLEGRCPTDTLTPGHSGRAVKGMNRLRSLEHWDRWFELRSRHGCLCVYSVLVAALRRVDPPSKES
jgi:hypothetical protein